MIKVLVLMLLVAIVAIPVGVHLGFRAPRVREQGSTADLVIRYLEWVRRPWRTRNEGRARIGDAGLCLP
jgi:hypothetical protein